MNKKNIKIECFFEIDGKEIPAEEYCLTAGGFDSWFCRRSILALAELYGCPVQIINKNKSTSV